MLLLDSLFMMIQLLVIEMLLITWSYYVSTSLPIDLDCHSLHLFDSGFITKLQPSPTCWNMDQEIWISGSWVIHHSSDSSVLGMSNFASTFLVICPVLLMMILPESYTIQLWFKPWVRPNASFVPKKLPSLLIPFYLGGGSPLLGISQVALTQISWPKTWLVAIHLPFQQLPPPYCVHLMVWGYAHFHHEKIIQIIITPTFFQILILLLILASLPLILTPMLMIVFNYICRILLYCRSIVAALYCWIIT